MSSRRNRPVRESDRLAREAQEMEARLLALRQQMSQTRQQRQSDRSGGLWRSARADRGSIRNYHTDVRKRAKAKGKGRSARPTGGRTATTKRSPRSTRRGANTSTAASASSSSSFRRGAPPAAPAGPGDSGAVSTGQPVLRKTQGAATTAARPRSARRLLGRADAPSWTVADVLRWLDVLSLSQYKDTFAQNQISGEVLLELTSEDLDFMDIKILGHRKMLLKGVQTLQRAVAGEAPLTARRDPPPAPVFKSEDVELVYDNSAHNNNVGTEVKGPKPERLHWSQAKPLSDNVVSNADVPVNLADGHYDEAAQRAAFQQAVMEWRGSGKAISDNTAANPSSLSTNGMWTNPFASAPTATSSSVGVSGAASGAGSGSGSGSGGFMAGEGGATPAMPEPPAEGGGKLLNGSLDVAAEHAAFERAVEAWRKGNDMPAAKTSCYSCYKLFYKESAQFESDAKSFCSPSCLKKHRDTQARLKKQQEEAAARRASVGEAERARVAAIEAGRSASRLGTPLKVERVELDEALTEAQSTLAKVAPSKDIDNIWAMDIGF